MAGLILTWLVIVLFRQHKHFASAMMVIVAIFSIVSSSYNIFRIRSWEKPPQDIYNRLYKTGLEMEFPDDPGARVVMPCLNLALVSQVPSSLCLHSSVNGSIFEFFKNVGEVRGNGNVQLDKYADLSRFLSLKYEAATSPREGQFPRSTYDNGTDVIYLYENPDSLPMGFTFQYYVTDEQLMSIDSGLRHWIYSKALIV